MNDLQIFNSSDFGEIPNSNENGFGYVYVIGFDDKVKIGCTTNPKNRIKTIERILRNFAGTEIKKVALSEAHSNYYGNEKHVHNMFSEYRISGSEVFNIPFDEVVCKDFSEIECKREIKSPDALDGLKKL